ncbi:LysR substrate-binding domain-containing protein [Verticiella sediminum]|nr:LysR substrate-binding domain-containing protein [Verticiella sediminum]
MELRHLRYFVAVAEEQHVTRAARRLGMQQPPLTMQIQLLEQELGVQLFTRSPRRIELNDAGRVFLDDARKLLAAADAAVQRVRRHDQAAHAVLRIGLTTSSAIHGRTRSLLNGFRTERPHASLHLEEGAAIDLLNSLQRGTLDIAFIRAGTPAVESVDGQWLAEDELVVAVPISHPYAQASQLGLADLKSESIILYRQERCAGIGDMLLASCARAGFQPRIAGETRRLMSAVNMAAAGVGMTIVPKSMEALRMEGIVYRPMQAGSAMTAPVNMVFRRNDTSDVLHEFLSMGRGLAAAGSVARQAPG